jgi:hypothetical protein
MIHGRVNFSFLITCLSTMLSAQNSGRFEEAKRMGVAYLQSEQFDKAAGRLEEVWEQDQSDASVGESLALAYLNTIDRQSLPLLQARAFDIIEKLVASGSRVTFLVLHSHEKLGWLQGRELNRYCRGRFSVEKNRLTFVSESGERNSQHSFDLAAREVNSIALNKDDKRGTFQLKVKNGSYFMATRNRNSDEARVIVDLVHRELGLN